MYISKLCGSNLPVLQSQLLAKETGIVHFSTMRGITSADDPYSQYNMCDYTGDSIEHVSQCRKSFAEALGISPESMWFPHQVHGTEVVVVDSKTLKALEAETENKTTRAIETEFASKTPQVVGADAETKTRQTIEADAVITFEKHLLIGVSTADCVPILVYNPINNLIAAIHAGWRGTVAGIVTKTLNIIKELSNGDISSCKAMIGPSIAPDAFEVGDEVAEQFRNAGYGSCVISTYKKPHIDLWQANVMQLLNAGLSLENIDCTPVCTYNNPDSLFSARRIGIKSGRITTAIMLQS